MANMKKLSKKIQVSNKKGLAEAGDMNHVVINKIMIVTYYFFKRQEGALRRSDRLRKPGLQETQISCLLNASDGKVDHQKRGER